jgi:hypothetical protein
VSGAIEAPTPGQSGATTTHPLLLGLVLARATGMPLSNHAPAPLATQFRWQRSRAPRRGRAGSVLLAAAG